MIGFVNLFSYGTLQLEEIQLETFGRKLDTEPDSLIGYEITLIPIQDEFVRSRLAITHYRNLRYTGNSADVIDGSVLTITDDELKQADVYEADAEYERIEVELNSGVKAWVYLRAE